MATSEQRAAAGADPGTLDRLRGWLLLLHAGGAAGALAELLLLEHWEAWQQWAPLLLLGLDLAVTLWVALARSGAALRAFQGVLALGALSGMAGLWLHYQGNVAFKLELSPGLSGFALVREALMGATPALAPGTMLYLAAIGWVYTFRHPALGAGTPPSTPS